MIKSESTLFGKRFERVRFNGMGLLIVCITWMWMGMPGSVSAQHQHEGHGQVSFESSCDEQAEKSFEEGLTHLHHMMYDQARPAFEEAAEHDPDCAMAYWGIAMTGFQPLWAPSSDEDMNRGKEAVEKARSLDHITDREKDYLETVAAFFDDPGPAAESRPADHQARVKSWLDAQQSLHEKYPDDVDAAAFYGLAEISYAMTQFSPDQERDFTREKRAGELMEQYLEDHPDHPGLFHYLIHAYDSSTLAEMAEDVARGYDQLAPDTPHALHMPSHIFVRLGLWEDTAEWNERSAEAAARNPVNGRTSLHYPHALDYLMYAYLQMDNAEKADEVLEKVRAIESAQHHFAAAYGIAAAQARYYLEQQLWEEAASLEIGSPDILNWDDYPGALALMHYARGLGAARTGDLSAAERERDSIRDAVSRLDEQGDRYWSHMTGALADAVDAWILYENGETDRALRAMKDAADREDAMDKHPITPGEVLPIRELYAEMLMMEGQLADASEAYQASLERTPNRKNALSGTEKASREE